MERVLPLWEACCIWAGTALRRGERTERRRLLWAMYSSYILAPACAAQWGREAPEYVEGRW